ncbi:MAG: YciI family protein [Acidimicrobiales bacterium]
MRFVIHAEDRADSLELRKATRPTHLAYMNQFPILVGGPMLDANGDPCGSTIIMEAESLEAAQEFAANDPYAKAGLFERVNIREFVTVIWPVEAP